MAVISISGIDIAFYNDTLVVKSNSFLKLYFTTEWISFNQSNSDCTSYELQTYSYQVAFSSTCYNFAAIYDALMVFNLTSTLLAGDFSRNFIALLSYNVSDAFPEYFGDYPFTFNQICGPVSNYYQLYQQQ